MQAFAQLADQLFDLVIDLDPARTSWEKLRENAQKKCKALSKEIDAVKEELTVAKLEASVEKALHETLESAKANLAELSDALNQTSGATRWRQLYASLARNYEQLTKALSERGLLTGVTFRRLSPVNYVRNLFHMAGGLIGALSYHYLLDRTGAMIVMAIFVVSFTTLEIVRRSNASMNERLMKLSFFRRVARAREYYQVNSSTYYAYGMLTAVILFPRQAVEAACLVLAVGDPIASNLGRKFGRMKIYKEKSVLGTVAFAVAAFIGLFAFQFFVYPSQMIERSLLVAAVGAIVGATAEALSVRLDDNLTVPLSVACILTFFVA